MGHGTEAFKSFIEAGNAATEGPDIFGVFTHAGHMVGALQHMLNPNARLAKQQKELLMRLREARVILSKGKRMIIRPFQLARVIKATDAQLIELERRASQAGTMAELNDLKSQVDVALGYK